MDTPRAPSGEQNAPGVTVLAGGLVVFVGLGVGFFVVAFGLGDAFLVTVGLGFALGELDDVGAVASGVGGARDVAGLVVVVTGATKLGASACSAAVFLVAVCWSSPKIRPMPVSPPQHSTATASSDNATTLNIWRFGLTGGRGALG